MPPIESVILVLVSGFILSLIPGPSMLYVLSRSIAQNYSAGIISSAGLAVGGMIHALAAATGLATIVALNPSLFTAIQIFGVIYLAYLGVGMLKDKINSNEMEVLTVNQVGYRKIFFQGVIVEASNPKTILFFLAFIPSLLSSETTMTTTQLLILGLLIPLTAIPSDLVVAFTGGKLAVKLKQNVKMVNVINAVAGVLLILLAVRLAFF